MGFLPRVEALHASTLGYEIATPTELLLLAGHNSSLMMRPPRVIYNLVVVDDMHTNNHVWLSHRGRCAPLATLKELRFPSPGLRAKLATLGKRPTNLATLTELRLAVGVTCNVFSLILEYTTTKIYKKICGFSGLCPMRPCVSVNISRACSRIFPATPIRACLMAG